MFFLILLYYFMFLWFHPTALCIEECTYILNLQRTETMWND